MRVAPDAPSAGAHASGLRASSLVLVDTPGVSPRNRGALRALQSELRAAGVDDVVVCVPATMSAGAARELVAAGQRLGARSLALTHADETEHVGQAVGVAMQSAMPFAYVGQTPNGVPAVRPAVAEELAKALLGSTASSRRRQDG
jgi:flagellar biosynthesis GTPase FlhF